MKTLNPYSRLLVAISTLLLVSAYFVPLWQILMWAPQYPEGLDMKIWINNITGDVKIISALNHYIGMKHIEVSMFPEFGYMIYILAGVIAAGTITALVNRRFMIVAYASILVACGIAALVDFYVWGYNYGHNLDPRAPIVVPGMSYQPPLIGTKQLLNFTAFSGPDTGGWIFLASGCMVFAALTIEILASRSRKHKVVAQLAIVLLCVSLISCSVEPEKLEYGKDACHHCKMTLMDNKFGGELVTAKGKVYKFDDTNCMIQFFNSDEMANQEIAYCLITDFSSPGKLIDARNALYIKSEKIKSPMAGNMAAFEKKPSLDQYNKSFNGILLSWGEIVTEYK